MADGALIFFRSGRIGEKEMAICADAANRHWPKSPPDLGNALSLWPSLRYQRLAVEALQCGGSGVIDAAQILRMMRKCPRIDHLFAKVPGCLVEPLTGRLHALFSREVKIRQRYDCDCIGSLRRQLLGNRRSQKDHAEAHHCELADA
jgi:hypothetical protein